MGGGRRIILTLLSFDHQCLFFSITRNFDADLPLAFVNTFIEGAIQTCVGGDGNIADRAQTIARFESGAICKRAEGDFSNQCACVPQHAKKLSELQRERGELDAQAPN